jgi:hypothetical protein
VAYAKYRLEYYQTLINPKTKEVRIDMDFNQSNDNTFRLRTNKITLMNKSSCSNMRMIDREKTCCRTKVKADTFIT